MQVFTGKARKVWSWVRRTGGMGGLVQLGPVCDGVARTSRRGELGGEGLLVPQTW